MNKEMTVAEFKNLMTFEIREADETKKRHYYASYGDYFCAENCSDDGKYIEQTKESMMFALAREAGITLI